MTILRSGENSFTFRVTPRLIDFFNTHRIRTTNRRNVHRWEPDAKITAAHDARFYSHTMLLAGNHVTQLQSFSYAFSDLDAFTTLGRYCSIAHRVHLIGPEHPTGSVTSSEILYRAGGLFADTFDEFAAKDWRFYPMPPSRHVVIGHDVWIGQDVLLKRGVRIGTGAIVGAGATVVKDVAPYTIVGGVPARPIRDRFPAEVAERLLALEWWRFAIPQLAHLPWDTPAAFIGALEHAIASGQATPFQSDLGLVKNVVTAIG